MTDFPQPAKKPIIGVLIGIDCVEFHSAVEEIRFWLVGLGLTAL